MTDSVSRARRISKRGLASSLAAAMLATLLLAGTTVAAPGGPWQQQSTTCLVGPHLVDGHVYWHSGTGKTGCWRD
jgi:hypothetical protein